MKAVILAGGLGTRISEETHLKPKPMVEIGGKPILWHIMKLYSGHGINDFVICCGYKGYVIKEYFANYFLHMSDVTFDLANNRMEVHQRKAEPWRVTLVDTGEETHDGRAAEAGRRYLRTKRPSASPMATAWRTSTSRATIAFHRSHGKLATVTAVQPPGRFGALQMDGRAGSAASSRSRGRWRPGSMVASSCCRRRCLELHRGRPDQLGRRAADAPGRRTAN